MKKILLLFIILIILALAFVLPNYIFYPVVPPTEYSPSGGLILGNGFKVRNLMGKQYDCPLNPTVWVGTPCNCGRFCFWWK